MSEQLGALEAFSAALMQTFGTRARDVAEGQRLQAHGSVREQWRRVLQLVEQSEVGPIRQAEEAAPPEAIVARVPPA